MRKATSHRGTFPPVRASLTSAARMLSSKEVRPNYVDRSESDITNPDPILMNVRATCPHQDRTWPTSRDH